MEEVNKKKQESLSDIKLVLEEIEKVLHQTKENTTSCLSVYERDDVITLDEVNKLYEENLYKYLDLVKKIEKELQEEGQKLRNKTVVACVNLFEKKLVIRMFDGKNIRKYVFEKVAGKITSEKTTYETNLYEDDIDILTVRMVSDFYDEYEKYKSYANTDVTNINTVNSKFKAYIKNEVVGICSDDGVFNIKALDYGIDTNNYRCENKEISRFLTGREHELYENIYVRIKDCPKWMQESLYKRRKEMLGLLPGIEENDIEENIEPKQTKSFRQKILSIFRKK